MDMLNAWIYKAPYGRPFVVEVSAIIVKVFSDGTIIAEEVKV